MGWFVFVLIVGFFDIENVMEVLWIGLYGCCVYDMDNDVML